MSAGEFVDVTAVPMFLGFALALLVLFFSSVLFGFIGLMKRLLG